MTDAETEANILASAENANLKYMAFQDMKQKENELENAKNKLNIASTISQEKGKKKSKKDNSRIERKHLQIEQRKAYLQKEINKKIDLATYYETLAQKAREDAAKLQMSMTDEIYFMEQSIETSTSDNETEQSAAIIRHKEEIKKAEKEYLKAKEIFSQYDEIYKTLEQEREQLLRRNKERIRREEERHTMEINKLQTKKNPELEASHKAHNDALWAAWRDDKISMEDISPE